MKSGSVFTMLRIDGWREYEKRETNPEIQKQNVTLKKKKDISLGFDIPYHGLVSIPLEEGSFGGNRYHSESLRNVLSIHGRFRIAMQEWSKGQTEELLEQAVGEVKAIGLFFPDVRAEHVRICMAAWLAVLCTVDDLLELMSPHEAENAIQVTIAALQGNKENNDGICDVSTKGDVCFLMSLFQKHCCQYLSDAAVKDFFREICTVFRGFLQENQVRQGYLKRDLKNYMEIRTRTIGVAPFFSLIKSDLFPPGYCSDNILAMQKVLNVAVGLQNDLVGLEKDIDKKESMNAVLVSMEEPWGKEEAQGTKLADTIAAVCAFHNSSVAEAVRIHQRILQGAEESEIIVANSQLLLTETHFKWCTTAKRYRTKLE